MSLPAVADQPLSQGGGGPWPPARELGAMWAIVLLSLAIRLAWVFLLPWNEGPDEFAHASYVAFLAEHHRLPTALEVYGNRAGYYGSTSPFPYLMNLLGYELLPHGQAVATEVWKARLGSAVAGALTVATSGFVARTLFREGYLRLGIPAFMAVMPQFTFVSAYVNADVQSVLVSCLLVWAWARTYAQGLTTGNLAGVSLGVAGVVLSKPNAYLLLPLSGLVLLLLWTRWRLGPRDLVRALVWPLLATGALAGPFLLLNYFRFGSDLLGIGTVGAVWRTSMDHWFLPLAAQGKSFLYVPLQTDWFLGTFKSFWGGYGYMRYFMAAPIYVLLALACLGSAIGWVVAMVRRAGPMADRDFRWFAWILVAAGPLAVALALWSSWKVDFQAQGRYLFPVLLPVVVSLLLGATQPLPPRWRPAATWAWVALLGAANLWSYGWLLRPVYGH